WVCLLTVGILAAAFPSTARAQLKIISDAEIEALLRDYARPIFKAAGFPPNSVDIVLVQNSAINAFVSDSRRVFIFTGLLDQAKTPGEVIGVIAHEAGHIAGGHLARSRQELRQASINNIIATLAGAAAIAGGSIAGSRGISDVGVAILQGGQQ
ncbi:MAG: M48 family metallopeptidase, partial [Hyphomicrobiales bacterium]